MIDIFGQTIYPGDSFLRIENQVGGARLRYYFYAGEAEPKQKNGWMITDMSIDNVSTADSYNRQFQGIIRKRGFDALLTSLRKRAERISEGGN